MDHERELIRREAQLKADAEEIGVARFVVKVALGILLIIFLFVGGCGWLKPQYNLYKANTEKQAVIREQEAQSKAAEYRARSEVIQAQAKADAEVIRAKGIAEANKIIASSITPAYVDYLYVRALETTKNQVVYVPTEAGLPVLEATRGLEGER